VWANDGQVLNMRIVVISASFVPSTAANSIEVMKVANALSDIGHQVTLIVPGEATAKWDELSEWYGIRYPFEIIWLKENLAFRRYDFALKATRKALQLKPDLVYTWMLQAAVLSLWHRIPVMLELHDRIRGKIAPTLFKSILHSRIPRLLLPITRALVDVLERELSISIPAKLIHIAPSGIELERYADLPQAEDTRKLLGLPEGLTAGYSGHFYSGRGMDLLLSLANSFPGVNFLWVGGQDKAVAEWRQRLHEQGVANVTLTGFIPNQRIAVYQAACDILLMPYELSIAGSGGGNTADICSPMKMFEYMAAGRAIMTSDLPVLREVLNEQNAVFCATQDIEAWEMAFGKLINDPIKRQTLGEHAIKDVQAYSWNERATKALAKLGLP